METFGDRLIRIRRTRNLTQGQLAKILGISKRAVASYETDGRMPHKPTLKKMAETLGVTVSYLTGEPINVPQAQEERPYIQKLIGMYGIDTANEVKTMLEQNATLFAGGKLDQESKDQYFLALANAYSACKRGNEIT